MKCFVCGIEKEAVELFEGISSRGIVNVCIKCSENESIPLLKKASENQLEQMNKTYTVRERMDRLSSPRKDRTEISKDQSILQNNLSRLKIPPKKEINEQIVEDYYWQLNMARRRRKLTLSQTAENTMLSVEVIESIEKGRIPKNFEEVFPKLENFFGIKLLKLKIENVKFVHKKEDEEKILRDVQEKMKNQKEIGENLSKISRGDLSRIKDLSKVTISDLQDLKKKKEEEERKVKRKEMIDEEFELELEEERS